MSDVEYYKKMMRQGDTTDYTSGEFLGEQAMSHRTKSPASISKKWTKTKEHVNSDWLGSSPGKRKSYVVKSVVKPSDFAHLDVDDDEEEKAKEEPKPVEPEPTPAPTPAPVPKEEVKPVEASPPSPTPVAPEEKKEEVDPAVAKYKAMLHGEHTTDYSTNEFLGDQAAVQRKSTTSSKKKWGKPIERSNDGWLSGSPTKRKSYTIKTKKVVVPDVHYSDEEEEKPKKEEPEPAPKEISSPVVEEESPASPQPTPVEKKEEIDPAVAKYKAMLHGEHTTDYSTNEFLGDQAAVQRKSTTSSKKKWGKPIERSNDGWLSGSPTKRKSYTIKTKKVVVPDVHYSDEEEEKPKEEPKTAEPEPAPKEVASPVVEEESPASPQPTPVEKKEEVDPAVAKYKAMLHGDHTTDYSTNEFLGDQAAVQRKSTTSSKKKWGKPIERSNDGWLSGSPTKRKSYTIKTKAVHTTKPRYDDEEPKQVSPVKEEIKEEASPVKKVDDIQPPKLNDSDHDASKEAVKEPEVDPSIAKFKAMMHRDEGNDYATNEFLGEQAQVHRTTKAPKKKWGTPIEKTNDNWLGGGGGPRKSYTIKGSSSKPPFSPASPIATRASFSPMASPKITSPSVSLDHTSPVSAKERMGTRASFSHAMNVMHSSKITSPRTSLTHESPVSDKERTAGRKSFSNAFAKFKSNDTALPAAFATASTSPTKRNFRVSKEAQAKEKEAHRNEEDHEPSIPETDEVPGLHDEHKEEFEEALQMLQKIFNRLDDREPSWKQMDAVIKKIRKATKQGADIKAILSYSITSLQHIAGLLYDEDQSDTDDVVEKLIDLNMQV